MSAAHWSDDRDTSVDSRDEAEFIAWLGQRAELETLEAKEQFEEESIETDGLAVDLVRRSMVSS